MKRAMLRAAVTLLLGFWCAAGPADAAQVHHFPGGAPWDRTVNTGPDKDVPGWFYQLGVTGIRVKLDDEAPTHLVVGYVFPGSPAEGKVEVGDHIVGAGGERFETAHQNGYGMEVFGPRGPIEDFARALSKALLADGPGRLPLALMREGKETSVTLKLGRRSTFGPDFPRTCDYSPKVLAGLLETLAEAQDADGSFGDEVLNTFAPLALLASGERRYRKHVERSARFHGKNTAPESGASLVNWRYMAAAIVLSEWHLASGDRWVIEELQEIYTFLHGSQYVSLAQVQESVRESHPDSYPDSPEQQHGGWGHNSGFEGYGPIAMLTGQGALAYAMMERCGIEIDKERHLAAYAFLERGTGPNGYTWYGDAVAGKNDWADMGRTGAAALALQMSPFPGAGHRSAARKQLVIMSEKHQSFPDTHGSPLMGMGYGAAAAATHRPSYDALMAANRWWFVLADCGDGTFHYQPNRDNAGYDGDARLRASAVAAFMLLVPEGRLALNSPRPR